MPSLGSAYEPLVIPDLVGHRQTRKDFFGRWFVRLDAQYLQYHHELTHVLARMPSGPLQKLVQRHIAIINQGLARKIGRLTRAIPPDIEAPQHVLSVG